MRFSSYCFVFVAILLSSSLRAQQCEHPDYDALMALYNATNGANWTDNTGWADGAAGNNCTPCNGWAGITCSQNRVTEIVLMNNGLAGDLPVELTELTNLTILKLGDNAITGSLPSEINALTNLEMLDLNGNELNGTIPTTAAQMPGLIYFNLSQNNLTGSIPDFGGTGTALQQLILSNNMLTGEIPISLGDAANLFTLELDDNFLTGELPAELGNAISLINFMAGDNLLEGEIPAEIAGLPILQFIKLSGNNLTGGLPVFTNSAMLNIQVANNQLSGSIPVAYTTYQNLSVLICRDNHLTGEIPEGFGDLTSLFLLDLADNHLYGCLPADLNNRCGTPGTFLNGNPLLPWQGNFQTYCTNDEQVGAPCDDAIAGNGEDVIGGDCLCGDFAPPVDCEHPDYAPLAALYNATDGENWVNSTGWLSDCDPCSWAGVTCSPQGRVRRLNLPNNNLTGELPAEMAGLEYLKQLNLTNNSLQGYFPYFFANHTHLSILGLGYNELIGGIPPEAGEIPQLHILDLSHNQLTGVIAEEIGDLQNIRAIDASHNQLSGSIPPELGQLGATLTDLFLNDNDLSGCFPEELAGLCQLDYVSFSHNFELPWFGDFSRFCSGDNQIYAPCTVGGGDSPTLEFINEDCECSDTDDENDCTLLVGAPCDDGDPTTINDTYGEGCRCSGEPLQDERGDKQLREMHVFPNPATGGTMFITVPDNLKSLKLYDVTGRVVKNIFPEGGRAKLGVDNLPPGVYLVSGTLEGKIQRKKVIIR